MLFILAEDYNYPIGSYIDKLKEKFPPRSTIRASHDNLVEIRKKIQRPPMLTAGWLVLVFIKDLKANQVKTLDVPGNLIVFVSRDRETFNEHTRVLKEYLLGKDDKLTIINNLDPERSAVEKYVMNELQVSYELSKTICRRHRYYLPKVHESVEILKTVDKITKTTIEKYTERSADITYFRIFDYVIGTKITTTLHDGSQVLVGVKRKKVYKYLETHPYGSARLGKYLLERFKVYLQIYKLRESGIVSLSDYKEYYEKHRVDMKGIDINTLRSALESYQYVSYEKLYFLYCLYEKNEGNFDRIKLLELLEFSKY